jgi:hypothetical protein
VWRSGSERAVLERGRASSGRGGPATVATRAAVAGRAEPGEQETMGGGGWPGQASSRWRQGGQAAGWGGAGEQLAGVRRASSRLGRCGRAADWGGAGEQPVGAGRSGERRGGPASGRVDRRLLAVGG